VRAVEVSLPVSRVSVRNRDARCAPQFHAAAGHTQLCPS
jgi:hypothetical protein